MRARDHGIVVGTGTPGPLNAITDVAGVLVGHTTLTEGTARTGVTVVRPHPGSAYDTPVYAGFHWLNGNGEMTGLPYLTDFGQLHSPIALTNTFSVGVVRDALVSLEIGGRGAGAWSTPVVAETWDGRLNDIDAQHVDREHVASAYREAASGPVAEGSVGGGTGMICHGFKGGTGTASRLVDDYTVGVLVQANHGARDRLTVNGRRVVMDDVPKPGLPESGAPEGAGSIIVVIATDAPLLPHQCRKLAQRAGLGVARTGGSGETTSGDGFICFSTGNLNLPSNSVGVEQPRLFQVNVLADAYLDPFYHAVVEATEEAIVNVLVAADTMTGANGVTAHGLDGGRLADLLKR
ncbi:P1 family peptidase [Nonomuraea sp. NN258]|uniref:DmpA family aminopeptidase n=1 Tax=Nonomuraea antri TaxID=2730852 RepID=UPI001568C5AE|nr:P1 family peptidase [Nonomuraea antri]NRQ38451.1 P1 family peptidase [Nonomuraea antri]